MDLIVGCDYCWKLQMMISLHHVWNFEQSEANHGDLFVCKEQHTMQMKHGQEVILMIGCVESHIMLLAMTNLLLCLYLSLLAIKLNMRWNNINLEVEYHVKNIPVENDELLFHHCIRTHLYPPVGCSGGGVKLA